jgi:hypothetical protein
MQKRISFKDLSECDLEIDAIYEGDISLKVAGDPIHKLLPGLGNVKGIRYISLRKRTGFCALVSSGSEMEWPDNLDLINGILTYYGDNREPGHGIHDKDGNRYLKEMFEKTHEPNRKDVRPFFYFEKYSKRDYIFRGICVPGASAYSQKQDLTAIWNSKGKMRYQNYKAIFTVLNISKIPRSWINDIINGNLFSPNCPDHYLKWVNTGIYNNLKTNNTRKWRTKEEQLPTGKTELQLIKALQFFFKDDPFRFEECAGKLFEIMDKNVASWAVTQMVRDGGRDVIGKYRIGTVDNEIIVDFAIEAKCWELDNGVGVKGSSRLISRIKNRQFGVLVTTSYLGAQPYQEVIEDGHPILVIAANDIVQILKENIGIQSVSELNVWLENEFPLN